MVRNINKSASIKKLMNMAEKEKELEKNKKAWIKILESSIAVMLMVGFFTILTMKHVALPDISDEVYELKRAVLKDISQNDLVRQATLEGDAETVYEYVERRLSPSVKSAIRICNPDEKCEFPVSASMQLQGVDSLTYHPKDLGEPKSNIYSDDYIISSSLNVAGSRIIKMFVWFEEGVPDLTIDPQICGDGEYDNEPVHEECEFNPSIIYFDSSGTLLSAVQNPTCQSPQYNNAILGTLSCNDSLCQIDSSGCESCNFGMITFVGAPVNELGKIKFTATGASGTYYLETYTPQRTLIDSESQNFVDAERITNTLLYPTQQGSIISIRYNSGCQDYYLVA